MLYRLICFIAKVVCTCLFHVEVKGRENVNKVKGAILAVNHTSFLDPVLASTSIKRPVYFLARKDLFQYKYFGTLCRRIHAIPFNRDASDVSALRNIIKLLKSGQLVLIFPEGTRSPDGELLRGKGGIGLVALKAGVPIVPVYIKGAYKVLPRHRNFIRLGKVKVFIGEPIYLDTWSAKPHIEKSDYTEVADLVMTRLEELKIDSRCV